MRTTSLDVVDNKRINCSFHKGFREFNGEVLAETCLLHWVQSSFLSRFHHLDGGRAGVLREIGSLFGKVGEGEGEALVFGWGNSDSVLRLAQVGTNVDSRG